MNLINYLPQMASGLMITLILMLASLCLGLLLAVLMTGIVFLGNRYLKTLINSIIFFIRGTPLLVQLFLIYYGAGQFAWIRDSSLWFLLRDPMVCAIIALAINSACYTTVILQGAIHSIPKNEAAGCEALGMSKWQAFRLVIFPRAFRIALPAYSNEIVMILKSTSLASTITLLDLMGVTQQFVAETYSIEFYVAAGGVYLLLNGMISGLVKMISSYLTTPGLDCR